MALETREKLKSGGQPGNDNATKNRPFREALDRAIAQDKAKRLRRAAEVLLTKAASPKNKGNLAAIGLLADRLDGRAVQPLANHEGGELKVVIQAPDVDA